MAFGIIVVLFWRICYISIGSENFSFVIFFWSMTREIVSYCIFLYLLDVLKILCISNILVFIFLVLFIVYCWDYRRFVVLISDVDLEQEFAYIIEKIQINFFNYLSWYYRSKLFFVIFFDFIYFVRVQEDILLQGKLVLF